ncbi:MAG: ribbon-helix-helix protein, CopG family [Promicromonosporaceae bacterium]|nr:ribbon-helix-helix protein, CopG family [Promicromonosporaceae bacterium]
MTMQLAVRLDDSASTALLNLEARTGKSRSVIVREALIDHDRRAILSQMRRESAALAADSKDLAESQLVLEEMRARRAW